MKILLAVDGSENSAKTVDVIGSHPWPTGSTVRVLTVVEQVVTATPEVAVFSPEAIEAQREHFLRIADELTTRFANWLCSSGLEAERLVRAGDPKVIIVEEALDWGADVIAVGSHGLSGITKWLLGSVAQSVVSHAPCSVYVVRERRERASNEEHLAEKADAAATASA